MAKAKDTFNDKINSLFAQEDWAAARAILEQEREKCPDSHWVLTQLGVTYYEERRYQDAIKLFRASKELVPDCPLTIWQLAGALDATGKSSEAIDLYTWLLRSKKSAREDHCWESDEWTETLKTDCVYRLGVCFSHQGKKDAAETCFRQYIDLLLSGVDTIYSIEDAMRQIRKLHPKDKRIVVGRELRKAMKMEFSKVGAKTRRKGGTAEFNEAKSRGQERAMSKR